MAASTSAAYDAAIYAPVRRTVATVGFDLAPPEAKLRAVVTSPAGNAFSRAGQLLDDIQEMGAPIATFEPDYWRLDGQFVLPVPPGETDYEIGWWGQEMSGANGQLAQPCVMQITFSEVQKVPSLGLVFDTRTGCTIADFDVFFYNSSGAVVLQESFRGNGQTEVYTKGGAGQVRSIRVVMMRTAQAYRFPRMSEINFGIRLRFDGESLLETSLVTEADPMGESVPFPRLQVTVRNDGRFNVLEDDDLSQYLQNRQALEYNHGVQLDSGDAEFVYGGAYYLEGWRVSDDRIVFDAAGASSVLEKTTYSGTAFELLSVGALLARVLAASGLAYEVDASLFSSPPVCAYMGEISVREAVKHAAMLAGAMVYEGRRNTMRAQDLLIGGAATDLIDYENMMEAPALRQSQYFNGILLTEYTAKANGDGFESAETFYPAPWYDETEPQYGYVVNLPCMVQNKNAQHAALREWFLERRFALLARRITAEVAWRQNPAQAVGDLIAVQADRRGKIVQAHVAYAALRYMAGVLDGETRALLV